MYPEVQLGQYKGLEVPQNHEAFDESKVDEEMHNVQKRNARLLDVEREAKMGDHVTIDFAGFIDGEQFDGGTAEDYDLELGANTFVPGFEEQIVGMKAGDERDVVVTFRMRASVWAKSVLPQPVGPMSRTLLFCSSTSLS